MRTVRTVLAPLCVVAALVMAMCPRDAAAQPATGSVAPLLWQSSMNVFRRFTVDRAKMIEFYGIDSPLGFTFPGLRTVWLSDPDGITNYFAETARSRQRAPATGLAEPGPR